jgi:hypothetical protein
VCTQPSHLFVHQPGRGRQHGRGDRQEDPRPATAAPTAIRCALTKT